MKEILWDYHIAGKLPEGEFKRLIIIVIDFDKGITILFNQCLATKPFNSRWVGSNLLELVSLLVIFGTVVLLSSLLATIT